MIGRARDDGARDEPLTSLLAITLGALVIVPAIVSTIHTFRRVQAAQRLTAPARINGWLSLVLSILFGPALLGYTQSAMNRSLTAPTRATAEAIRPPHFESLVRPARGLSARRR